MKRIGLAALFVVIIDRLTKYFFYRNLSQGEPIKVVPGFFHLTLVCNTGTAFGMFRGRASLFVILSLLVVALIIFYARRCGGRDLMLDLSLGLISGGAIGNLIDRVAFGCVIDFLDFRIWPVFNIADSSITIGAVLLAIKILSDKRCSTT